MFVVVNQKSGHTVGRYRNTLAGARRSATCLNKRKGGGHVAMSLDAFNEQDEMVEVRNLMSGNPVMIRKSDRGTCVDPSTERYWSM